MIRVPEAFWTVNPDPPTGQDSESHGPALLAAVDPRHRETGSPSVETRAGGGAGRGEGGGAQGGQEPPEGPLLHFPWERLPRGQGWNHRRDSALGFSSPVGSPALFSWVELLCPPELWWTGCTKGAPWPSCLVK